MEIQVRSGPVRSSDRSFPASCVANRRSRDHGRGKKRGTRKPQNNRFRSACNLLSSHSLDHKRSPASNLEQRSRSAKARPMRGEVHITASRSRSLAVVPRRDSETPACRLTRRLETKREPTSAEAVSTYCKFHLLHHLACGRNTKRVLVSTTRRRSLYRHRGTEIGDKTFVDMMSRLTSWTEDRKLVGPKWSGWGCTIGTAS